MSPAIPVNLPDDDLPAMMAICSAFLALDYLDKRTTAFEVGARAKAMLLQREGPALPSTTAGARVKAALLNLDARKAFIPPARDLGPWTLDGANFPVALSQTLGRANVSPPRPTPLAPTPLPRPTDGLPPGFSLSDWGY